LFTKKGVEKMIERKDLNVSLNFCSTDSRVWGWTRGIAHRAGFSDEYAKLRSSIDGFSNFDFCVDDLFDEIAVDFDMHPHFSFLIKKQ